MGAIGEMSDKMKRKIKEDHKGAVTEEEIQVIKDNKGYMELDDGEITTIKQLRKMYKEKYGKDGKRGKGPLEREKEEIEENYLELTPRDKGALERERPPKRKKGALERDIKSIEDLRKKAKEVSEEESKEMD